MEMKILPEEFCIPVAIGTLLYFVWDCRARCAFSKTRLLGLALIGAGGFIAFTRFLEAAAFGVPLFDGPRSTVCFGIVFGTMLSLQCLFLALLGKGFWFGQMPRRFLRFGFKNACVASDLPLGGRREGQGAKL